MSGTRAALALAAGAVLTAAVLAPAGGLSAQEAADSLRAGPAETAGSAPRAEDPPMVTDRPDFTESTWAVRSLQLEAGYTLERAGGAERHTLGESLLRLPAVRDVELRIGVSSYRWGGGGAAEGFTDASAGLKVRVRDAGPSAALPSVAILAGTTLPVGDASPSGLQPSTILALAWDLAPRVGLGANLGVAYLDDGRERFGEYSGSLALGVDLGAGLGLFLETYGLRPAGRPSTAFVDGGLTLGVTPDLQFDARLGTGVKGPAEDLALGVGLAVRR